MKNANFVSRQEDWTSYRDCGHRGIGMLVVSNFENLYKTSIKKKKKKRNMGDAMSCVQTLSSTSIDYEQKQLNRMPP